MTLSSKITSKNLFWSNVSLGWKSANSLISVLNTTGIVLSRNSGPKTWHPFGILFRISTTVWQRSNHPYREVCTLPNVTDFPWVKYRRKLISREGHWQLHKTAMKSMKATGLWRPKTWLEELERVIGQKGFCTVLWFTT